MFQWKIELAAFTSHELRRLTNLPMLDGYRLYEQYSNLRPKWGTELNTETVLGTLAIANLTSLRVDMNIAAPFLRPLVNEALLSLAKMSPIKFDGSPEGEAEYDKWLEQGRALAGSHRLCELLGLHEAPRKRYLTVDNDGSIKLCDDIIDMLGRAESPTLRVIDALGLAKQVYAFRPFPLFSVKEMGRKAPSAAPVPLGVCSL